MMLNMRDSAAVSGHQVARYCLAVVSLAAAVIHFAVSGEHFQEYWLFGVFMLVVAWGQLAWAVLAVARPSRALLWAGAVLNTGVIVVYIVTRTVGDVIGPTPNAVEPFGFGDGLCTVLEAVVAAGCCWLLISRADRTVPAARLIQVPAGTGAVTAVLLSVALVAGGPEMVMTMSTVPSSVPAINLATTSPAGNIIMPTPNMQMAPGMRMASSVPCDTAPTTAQQQAAVRLVNASWKGARKFRSLAVARADGYQPITQTGAPVVHYLSRSAYLATVTGGPVLDTTAPQSLVYANTPRGAVLVAAMYITRPGGPTPQPGGCLTQWHVHTNLCLRPGLTVVGTIGPGRPNCPLGSRNRVTPPMMHVWFVPIPGGPTAIDAPDAQVVRAAEQVPSPKNGTA
jgi:hypothetical protein